MEGFRFWWRSLTLARHGRMKVDFVRGHHRSSDASTLSSEEAAFASERRDRRQWVWPEWRLWTEVMKSDVQLGCDAAGGRKACGDGVEDGFMSEMSTLRNYFKHTYQGYACDVNVD